MSVVFNENTDMTGTYYTATVNSPSGGSYEVDPWSPLECRVVNQNKSGANGFGIAFVSGKNHRVLTVGRCGDAEKLLRLIKWKLNSHSFWSQ
jgi:hypothetical protein